MSIKTTSTARSVVRPLADDELLAFVTLAANAYPAWKLHSLEDRQKLAERFATRSDEHDRIYGLFREGALLGGMRLIDYEMNVRGASVATGGVGMVAVDLLHKKEKVARDLIRFYLDRCRAQGMPMAALYPFRPDFYKQMGFGYGTRVSQYVFLPAALPDRGSRKHLRVLAPADAEAMAACYARIQARTHGLMAKPASDMERMLSHPETRVVGVASGDGGIAGYLAFGFENDPGGNFIKNNLHVRELVYETPEALSELLAFLRTQADQIHRIVVETQDESFYYLLSDPRDESGRMIPSVAHQTNVEAVSLMYRVVDLRALVALLADAHFGAGDCRVRLAVRDSFVPANDGPLAVEFHDGRIRLAEGDAEAGNADVQLALDVAELSSLLMGAVDLERLVDYGLATLSDHRYLDTLTRIFATLRRPVCLTAF